MGINISDEKLTIEIDWESTSPQQRNKIENDCSVVANKSRRSGKDRRKFTYTAYIPERRSGIDRRGVGWYRN